MTDTFDTSANRQQTFPVAYGEYRTADATEISTPKISWIDAEANLKLCLDVKEDIEYQLTKLPSLEQVTGSTWVPKEGKDALSDEERSIFYAKEYVEQTKAYLAECRKYLMKLEQDYATQSAALRYAIKEHTTPSAALTKRVQQARSDVIATLKALPDELLLEAGTEIAALLNKLSVQDDQVIDPTEYRERLCVLKNQYETIEITVRSEMAEARRQRDSAIQFLKTRRGSNKVVGYKRISKKDAELVAELTEQLVQCNLNITKYAQLNEDQRNNPEKYTEPEER